MTTVLAVKTAKGVKIAADTQATDANGGKMRTIKITKNGQFLISGAGDCAALDILQYIWKPPIVTHKDSENLLRFMVVKVVPSIRKALEANKYALDKADFSLMVVVGGEIFTLEEELDVSTPQFNVAALGSGAGYALGAVRAGASIEQAMEIAAENDSYTSAPFTYLTQDSK